MASILERYQEKFKKSADIYQSAVQLIPTGGHQSRIIRPFPIYVDDASGALKWDADGNELIDYIMGYGALLLGHAHPKVVDAVSKRLSHGTIMAGASQLEMKWAELVSQLIPSAERVRFTGSGTESTLMAIRLARAFTGKRKIVKFHQHFQDVGFKVLTINTDTPKSMGKVKSYIRSKKFKFHVAVDPNGQVKKKLKAEFIGRGGAWLDTGSFSDFYNASSFVSALENRQGLKIACLEEIALGNKWIGKKHIEFAMQFYGNCDYSNYLKKLF